MFKTTVQPPREHVPPGLQVGRFTQLIDCGTQNESFQGKPKVRPVIRISAEFPAHKYKTGDLAGKPLVITAKFTNSMSERSNLRHFIDGYRGEQFASEAEINKWMGETFWRLVGKIGKFTVVHKKQDNGSIFSTFEACAQEEGMICPPPVNKPVLFTMADVRMWNPSQAERAVLPEPQKSIVAKYGPMFEVFKSLHEKAQEYIAQSPEFKAISSGRQFDPTVNQPDAPTPEDDDVPF